MPVYAAEGVGGGGGGLTLGPPTNSFTAATRAAAETARNTYATANASWLASYDDEATYTIIIAWPATPTNTIYQARRSSSWADVTGLVRGPTGAIGAQGRFLVYEYINAATGPTAAPTGGTFVRSTGTLTTSTGYAAVPSTPATGETTYRAEAVVNPGTDSNSVTLTWSVPAELPAYAVVALADASATAAAASATAAASSATAAAGSAALVTSYSGPAAILDDVAFESNNADFTVTGWREYDFLQVVLRDSDATTQFTRPASLIDTVTLDSIGEARAAVNNNDEIRLSRTAGSDVLSLNINGWSGHPTTGDVVTFLGVRSGVQGGGGGGGGGGLDAVSSDTTLTGDGTDADILGVANPFTAADETKLDGIAAGAQVNVGTNLAIANRDASVLHVTSSTGNNATVPAATTALAGLMTAADKTAVDAAQTETEIETLIQAALAAMVTGNTETGITVTYHTDGTIDFVVGTTPDPTHTSYCGTSADTTITEVEATGGTTGTGNALAVPTYTGALHVFFLRPTSEGAITAVYIYDDGSPNTQNQISAWTAFNLSVGGVAHDGVYSVALTMASGLIVEVV